MADTVYKIYQDGEEINIETPHTVSAAPARDPVKKVLRLRV